MPDRQRGYAAGTPPSTLSRLPVVFDDRASEAKCSTAAAMSSGSMLTPSVVRARYVSSAASGAVLTNTE